VHAQVVAPAPLVLPAGHAVQMLAPDVALYVLAVHWLQTRLAPVPLPAKPALHWHVDALAPLELLAGQELQMLAPAALKEPAKHALQLIPEILNVPAVHAVQVSVSAVPFVEKPGEHVHVVAVAPLVLPAGHAEQDDAPAALKVLAVQAVQERLAPLPACAKPAKHVHEAALALLPLLVGHALHALAAAKLYEPGKHAAHSAPAWL
jgi:hypothetical protein